MKTQVIIENIKIKDIIKPELTMRLETEKASIQQLVNSVKKFGLINPLTVKKTGKYFEVVAGFRRYLAVSALEWKEVPCIIINPSPDLAVGIMTAENYEREDVNVFDEAIYLKKLIDKSGCNQKQLAEILNRTASYVSERLAIIDYIEPLRDALYQGKISFSVARELNKIKDEADKVQYTKYAVENGCTPDVARRWRKQLDAAGTMTSEEMQEKAIENYNNADNKVTVNMLCNVCKEEYDVNELRPVYVCQSCLNTIRKGL